MAYQSKIYRGAYRRTMFVLLYESYYNHRTLVTAGKPTYIPLIEINTQYGCSLLDPSFITFCPLRHIDNGNIHS